MGITLTNNAHTTLSADASSTDTTFYVEDIDSFPTLDVGDYFYCTIERTSGAMEIVKVTQINSSSFIVERGQENTIPISFPIGSLVSLKMTVQNITDLILTGSNINDAAFDSSWNGDTSDAPSRNAVYDKFVTVDAALAEYTAADVLAKLLTVDGTGSGLDADTLDGNEAAAFALLSGATFAGTVAVSTGLAKIGTKTFSGAATLELKYNTGGSYNGQVSFLEFDVYKWSLTGRASTGAFALYNHTFLTDAITVNASNNATFSGTVTVPDDAYAAGWDGNLTVPTKNAVYDKIQSLATLSDGDKGDITVSASGATWTIDANTITLAKMATMATDSILGRATAGTGNVEVLTALPFAYTGDVTRAADSNVTTIANDAVTYAKMQNVSAQYKILGRSTAGAGDVEELSTSANMVSLIASADYATARTNLGLTALATTTPGTGVATFLATPSSANLASAVTDETGSGALVFATSPTLVTPALGVATATSIQAPPKISSETTGALTSASRNCIVQCSGGVTLPASGMSDGDSILIDPRGTARTITRPAAHTMYINDVDSATGTSGAHNVVTAVYHGSSKWTLQGKVA